MATETYTPRTTTEDKAEKSRVVPAIIKSMARMALTSVATSGVMIGAVEIKNPGTFENVIDKYDGDEVIEVDQANINSYRDQLEGIADGTLTMTLEPSLATPIDIVFDADTLIKPKGTYMIDGTDDTAYDETQPNVVQALDYVDPALAAASGVETVVVVPVGDGNSAEHNYVADEVDIDPGFAKDGNPSDIGDVINHELGHAVHDKVGMGLDTIPTLTAENPPYFAYEDAIDPARIADGSYNRDAMSIGVTTRPYGAKNEREDVATHVEAMFDKDVSTLSYTNTENYLNDVSRKNELTLDKTAVIAGLLDEAQPGLGARALENIENNLNQRR